MLAAPGGVHFPCSEIGKESVRLFANGVFKTSSGKVELTGVNGDSLDYIDTFDAPGNSGLSREEYPYLLSTNKVASHYHSECQYSDWANEMEQPYVEIHPLTALEIGVGEGELIRVETITGSIVLAAKITLSVPRGFLSTQPYYGIQSPYGKAPANTLFPVAADPVGGNLVSKNIICSAKAEGGQKL